MRRTEFVIHELMKPNMVMPLQDSLAKQKRSKSPQTLHLPQPHIQRVKNTQLAIKKKLAASQILHNDPLLTVQSALQPNDRAGSVSPKEKKKTFFLMKPSKQATQTGFPFKSTIQSATEEGASQPKEISTLSPLKVQKHLFLRAGSLEPDLLSTNPCEFVKLGTGISLQPKKVQSPLENSFRITLRKPAIEIGLFSSKKEVSNSVMHIGSSQHQNPSMLNFSLQQTSPSFRSSSVTDKVETPTKRKMFAGNRAAEPNRRLIRSVNCSSLSLIPPLESEVNNIYKATLYQPQNLFFRSAASGNSSPLKKKSIFIDIDGIICSLINKVDCSFDLRPITKPELPVIFLRTDSMDFLCDLKANHNIYLIAPRNVPEVIVGKIIHKLTGFGVRGIILKGTSKETTDFREVLTTLGLHRQPTLYSIQALPQEIHGSLTPESERAILTAVSDLYPSAVRVSFIFCSHLYMDIPASKFLDQDLGNEVGLITVNSSTLTSIIASLKHPSPFRIGQKESGRLLLQLLNDRMLCARQLGIESLLTELGVLQGKERTFPFPLTHDEYR
jgi:hypothetical protein